MLFERSLWALNGPPVAAYCYCLQAGMGHDAAQAGAGGQTKG